MTNDPFERAAKREEREEVAREMRMRQAWDNYGGGFGSRVGLVVFGIPYVIIALIRAANFDFGDPTMPQSLVEFFFGGPRRGFGIYTGWMLFLTWTWAISVASSWRRRRS